MQLSPNTSFAIVRQLEDHTDSNSYYVRAVIRNAQTDALITTVDLTDQGNRRFSKNWQVTADVSGQGFYISILTSVYTDAVYTTKSQNYGDKMETYLVQTRYNPNLGYGSGGSDIDYKRIRKIVKEVVDEIESPEPLETKIVIKEVVREIKVPEIVKIENTREIIKEIPIKTEIIREIMKEVKVPEVVKVESTVNLKPLTDKLKELETELGKIKTLVTPPPVPPSVPSPYDFRTEKMLGKRKVELSARTKKLL